jgi:receptor expression-enhancing protein 5/6
MSDKKNKNKSENKSEKSDEGKEELSLYTKWTEQMDLIQEKTGIPGTYVIFGLLAAVLFVMVGFLERLITNLVGTVYPAFWTMKSIEKKGDDDKQWLTYWVVFASFTIIDMFSGFILRFIPFYFFLKVCFLIWLFMPNTKGCHIVYHLLIIRVFKTFEQDIDGAADKLGEYTKELVSQGNNLIDKGKTKIAAGVVNATLGEKKTEKVILKEKENPFKIDPKTKKNQ